MGYQHKRKQHIENILIFYYKSRCIPSRLIYKRIFTDTEAVVLSYIVLYGYSIDMIEATARRLSTSHQVIRNTVAKLIKRGELRRLGKYNVEPVI